MKGIHSVSGRTTNSVDGTLRCALRAEHRIIWELSAICIDVARITEMLGRKLGTSGAQFLTLKAVECLAKEDAASIKNVAELLNVAGSFVSAQSKNLEEQGLLIRTQSSHDKRVMLLSLTEGASLRLMEVENENFALEELLCKDLEYQSVDELCNILNGMRRRLRRAMLFAAAGE